MSGSSPAPSSSDRPGPQPTAKKQSSDASSHQSPLRHHVRAFSANTPVKETRNARSEYSNSQDDGTSQLRINQYLIRQEIGRGSFGAVHLGTDQYGKEYAVKEFSKTRLRRRVKSNMLRQARQLRRGRSSPWDVASPTERAMNPMSPGADEDNSFDLIREEIAVMKKLHHGNLVSLIEVLDDPEEDSLYMVMEMCKKGVVMKVEVDEQSDPYDEEICRYWFRDLILGIEYLHSQGVIHRDIKPDNCLLTEDDTLKVVDFGVSEMFEKKSDMRIAKAAGSPAFMAPELCIIKHGNVAGQPADIWSMGVTLFCLRFGRVPFQKSAVLDLYDSIVNDPIKMDPGCGEQFEDLMSRLLEKDPTQRITMNEIREHPWVTKDGQDPLLSAEMNCSDIVLPPTEEEKNAAITGNMSRLVAVMKAVQRFKALTEKKKNPDLIEGILGRASRFVQPPLSFSRSNDSSTPTSPGSEQSSARKMFSHLKSSLASSTKSSTSDPAANSGDTDVAPSNNDEPGTPLDRKDSGRGHAHDPLEDQLFLEIGTGPPPGDALDTPSEYVVSESPPPAGYNLYERAYQEEVDRILQNKGSGTTIYSTRRIEGQHIGAMKNRANEAADGARSVVEKMRPNR